MSAGVVYGTAGGSLTDGSSFTGNAEADAIGAAGEQRVAQHLNRFARKYPIAVLHDLDIPGTPANIDHAIVHGSRIWILDAKVWKPVRYRTVRGKAYRGGPAWPMSLFVKGEPCDFADKQTMAMATDRLAPYLLQQGVHASLDHPLLVVCSSSARNARLLNLRKLRVPGADCLAEDAAIARIEKIVKRSTGFDSDAVQAMRGLLRGRSAKPAQRDATQSAPEPRVNPDAGW